MSAIATPSARPGAVPAAGPEHRPNPQFCYHGLYRILDGQLKGEVCRPIASQRKQGTACHFEEEKDTKTEKKGKHAAVACIPEYRRAR